MKVLLSGADLLSFDQHFEQVEGLAGFSRISRDEVTGVAAPKIELHPNRHTLLSLTSTAAWPLQPTRRRRRAVERALLQPTRPRVARFGGGGTTGHGGVEPPRG